MEGMTAVVDGDDTDADLGPELRGSPRFGHALVRLGIAHLSEAPPDSLDRAALIDGIAEFETLKNSLEAFQSEWILAFARAHAAERTKAGAVEPEKLERDIAGQIAPACRVSPTEGRKRVRVARDLHDGLDHLRRLFRAGEVSAYKVSTVVAATAHLDRAERAEVDHVLAGKEVGHRGVGKLRDLALSLAAQVAPEKFRARCAAARSGRRVTLRPASDGMTDLIAHLPAEQGAACYAALQKAFIEVSVSPAPMTRGRGQVMADTLVERVTGQATASDVNVQVQVVVPIEALVDPDSPLPAEIPGTRPGSRRPARHHERQEGVAEAGHQEGRCHRRRFEAKEVHRIPRRADPGP